MKRHLKKQYIVLIALLITIPILISSTQTHSPLEPPIEWMKDKIIPPSIPDKAIYAGEEIVLDRTDLRERMDRELMSFSYMHSSSILIIKRANRYFPFIEPILKANNVPDDLKYLMVIESSMDPFAVSPAGAAGFWQFMKGTARDFGLEVNANVDERFHIEKSTVAACKYLKNAYKKYGNWLTAAASYNAGQGRISGELSKQNEEYAADLWLVPETSRYMFRLMAAKQYMEDPHKFGFYIHEDQLYPPFTYKEVQVSTDIPSLESFAKLNDISYAQLKEANPWLKGRNLENKSKRTYTILIPTKESLFYNPKDIKAYNPKWVSR